MTRTGSFPYLNIAQDYGLDYGDVVRVAEYWRVASGRASYGIAYRPFDEVERIKEIAIEALLKIRDLAII